MQNIEATLILPCYNEVGHFENSVIRIFRVLKKSALGWEVIFIDDKSTDGTNEKIRELMKIYSPSPCLQPTTIRGVHRHISEVSLPLINLSKLGIPITRALFHRQNLGRGATVAEGIKKATGRIVGFIDIDCEIDPHYIPLFVDKVNEGYDVVCAWRIYTFSLKSIGRYLASQIYSFLVQKLFRVDYPDTEAGYKFFKRDSILPILTKVKSGHWFWDTEVMIRSLLAGLKVAHIPVVFMRRVDKSSTVKLIPDTIDYLRNLWRLRREIERNC